jgi:hypothetical protein
MAGPRLLDTEITTKTHSRAEQADLLRLAARLGARHGGPPSVGTPARAPAGTVVWWWRWRGDHGVPGPARWGPVAGGVV